MEKKSTDLEGVLARFLPVNALEQVCRMLRQAPCHIQITQPRHTMHGNFTVDPRMSKPVITVNGDLNPYSFLITLMHELAHLNTWSAHRFHVKPHGEEWKSAFRKTLGPFIRKSVFPRDVEAALLDYLRNPAAATCTDVNLTRVLARYDRNKNEVLLEDLPHNARFLYNDKRTFVKGKKLRTRYQCLDAVTKDVYLFSPITKVSKIRL